MRRTIAIVAVACCAANAAAQQWIGLDGPTASERAVVYDTRRGRAVLLGSEGGTWEFDGTTRLHRSAAMLPFARSRAAMVYDPARGHTLLFGGRAAAPLGDTWLWDGCSWRQPFSTLTPPRRTEAALAYDSARGRVVMFGGEDGRTVLNDTWEHDGSQWTQCTPLTVPLVASSPQMAFDSARNVAVLVVAGTVGLSLLLYEWNGIDWLRRTPASAPGRRDHYTLSHDPLRQRTVLFGGPFTGGEFWEWDGSAWYLMPAQAPFAPLKPGMFFDPSRGATVIVAGQDQGLPTAAWTWNGTTIASLWPSTSPQPRFAHAVYHDTARNRSVLFGGATSTTRVNDTWEWDGRRWTERLPATRPSPRQGATVCFDPMTGTGLLLGGSNASYLADCWRFDGSNWTQLPVATPPARARAAMAWDRVRNEALLFGGTNSTALGDTWRFNGTAWSQVISAPAPAAREAAAMAFDPVRGRIVLFGGLVSGPVPFFNDTWEWDGAQWQAIVTPQSPPGLGGASMIHDQVAGRMVVAGDDMATPQTDMQVWEYDGATWTLTPSTPGNLGLGWLVWDSVRQRRILFDGNSVLELTAIPAGVDLLGSGCGTPPPRLAARARPRHGEGLFGLELWTGAHLPALFALGWGAGSTPLGNGCTLLLQQVAAISFAISNASGLAFLPAPLPASQALRGLVFHAQGGVLDPADPGHLAFSPALRLTVGD